jgi:hypothetical protein
VALVDEMEEQIRRIRAAREVSHLIDDEHVTVHPWADRALHLPSSACRCEIVDERCRRTKRAVKPFWIARYATAIAKCVFPVQASHTARRCAHR